MNHKILFTVTALLLMSGSAFAQTSTCPDGMTTGSCNITEIGDRAHDGSQTVGDTINPTYSPDSASASASTGAIDVDAVGQGGTASSTATGNQSTNSNNSSANNSATNTMTNGSITNDVTGGNITGGSLTQTGSADITNSGGNVTGGTATTNSGNVAGGDGGAGGAGGSVGNVGSASSAVSGASTSTASGGNIAGSGNSQSKSSGGSVAGSGNSSSRSGVSGSGNSRNTNNNKTGNQTTNVDASNNSRYEYKEAARTSAPIMLPNVSNSVCDGGGSFGASIQTFGWGVTATRKKGDRFCQMLTIDPTGRAAMAYLGNVDNSVKKALVQNGFAVVHKTEVVRTETTVRALEKATTLACPDTAPNLVQKADGRMVCTNTAPTAPQPTRSESAPPTGTICPAGSSWDGRGCWRPAQ